MRGLRQRLPDEPVSARRKPPPVREPAAAAVDEPSLLLLQRSVGNAALARFLQREPSVPTGLGMRRPGSALDISGGGLMADYSRASDTVRAWFDKISAEANRGGSLIQSVAELVDMAGTLTFKAVDGKETKVRDVVKPNEIELGLRERAKRNGVRLLEHRDPSDRAGVESETMAILRNLGKIPTEVEFGGDDAKLTVSIFGKVSAEAKAGKTKLEAEASGEGVSGSASLPGGKGKLEGHASPEGGGGSVSFPGGKVGLDFTGKGVKAEVKAGDLVTVKGSIEKQKDGAMGWKAEITIGTLGKVIGAEDIAKVMKGAEETFSKSAGELARGIDDPAVLKEHGGALKDAVTEVAEKAKKSAAQGKPGWSVGAEVKGTDAGGFSASVTLTWVF